MENRLKIPYLILGLAMSLMILITFLVPDAADFQRPELARVIFYHVPCALSSFIFEIAAGWFGIRYLQTRNLKWDIRCGTALELSTLLSLLTLITGMLFSYVQWGAWWQWDPRQTSYLMLFLILAACLILRTNFSDEKIRATSSAIYSTLTLIPALFLVFVFPRLSYIQQSSLHPSQTLQQGLLDTSYSWALRGMTLLLLWFCIYIYRLQVQTKQLYQKIEEIYGDR